MAAFSLKTFRLFCISLEKKTNNDNSCGLEKCDSHVIPITTAVALFCRRLFGTTENRAVMAAVKNVLLASIYSTVRWSCYLVYSLI